MSISSLVYVDDTGFHYPDYPTVLEQLKNEYRTIYGADVYLEPDSQDGQWVSIIALATYDLMQVAAKIYSSFSPMTAMQDALSRNVKINGIARLSASYSTVDLDLIGQAGTTIVSGQAEDVTGQKWNLPASVVVPESGAITVTATAAEIGAKIAAAGSITKIATPTLGWQSVTNPLTATPGRPVESDAALRVRQRYSTALPSLSILEGLIGAVAGIEGVSRYRGYENDDNVVDENNLPPHSIAMVVEGGNADTIGQVIATKKTPGTNTHGTTVVTVYDRYGIPNFIRFFRPKVASIKVRVELTALKGYTSAFAPAIQRAVADFINSLEIGDNVLVTKLYVPANLPNTLSGKTFDITQILIGRNVDSLSPSNINLTFNEAAFCDAANDIRVVVV